MKYKYKRVIFERLTRLHILILLYYLLRGKEIQFFDSNIYQNRNKWLKRLVEEHTILRITPVGYLYNECYGTALDNIDRFYHHTVANSALVNEVAKMYEDKTIELAYKKELTRKLSEFFYINSYLNEEGTKLINGEKILFIPYSYPKYLKLAERAGVLSQGPKNIAISSAPGLFVNIIALGNKAKAIFFQTTVLIYFLIKILIPHRTMEQAKKYKYAIAIINPDFQFKFKNRSVDFLLDGNEITNKNTIFMLLNPGLTKDNMDEIKTKNLNLMDCQQRYSWFSYFEYKDKSRIIKRLWLYIIKNIFLGLGEPGFIMGVNRRLLSSYFKWTSILQKVNIRHFITVNDEGLEHVGRNIILNKSGAKTWIYSHSSSLGYINKPPIRHWLWSFLYYDYYVTWNNDIIEYYKTHNQKIGAYVNIGCLWSQSIVNILEGKATSELEGKAFIGLDKKKYKIVSFFDSSYLPNSISPLEDGAAFYRCILRLLDELPNLLVIIKEKKPVKLVLTLYENSWGNTDIFEYEYKPALEQLGRHPRCHITGYKGDPAEIIAMSDLTITYPFSSSTLEALSAGKKAVFFDVCNRWKGSYFDDIPYLVAHSYDELKALIQKFVYEMGEQETRYFLNAYIKGKVDPYLDGKAISRFQELLSGSKENKL